MNRTVKIVLVGPTGAGKSQFCNFLRNDLSNSIYKVKLFKFLHIYSSINYF